MVFLVLVVDLRIAVLAPQVLVFQFSASKDVHGALPADCGTRAAGKPVSFGPPGWELPQPPPHSSVKSLVQNFEERVQKISHENSGHGQTRVTGQNHPESVRLGECAFENVQQGSKSGEQSQDISSEDFENQNFKSQGLPIDGNMPKSTGPAYAGPAYAGAAYEGPSFGPTSSLDDMFGRRTFGITQNRDTGTGILPTPGFGDVTLDCGTRADVNSGDLSARPWHAAAAAALGGRGMKAVTRLVISGPRTPGAVRSAT
jgi:hypothetical protein